MSISGEQTRLLRGNTEQAPRTRSWQSRKAGGNKKLDNGGSIAPDGGSDEDRQDGMTRRHCLASTGAGALAPGFGARGALAQQVISGIKLPDSQIAREATELVRQHEPEILFNHSVRVYVFGAMKGTRQNIKFDPELLYVAALFHDLGLVDKYHTETKRFEVDGADAAREFLRSHGIAEPKADLVWEAIALHTTPGIPQYMRPEMALTQAGVLVDALGTGYDDYTPEQRDQVIAAFPRGDDFKNEFIASSDSLCLKEAHDHVRYGQPRIYRVS